MSDLTVNVSRGSLTVSAREALDNLNAAHGWDVVRGSVLGEAIDAMSSSRTGAIVHPVDFVVTQEFVMGANFYTGDNVPDGVHEADDFTGWATRETLIRLGYTNDFDDVLSVRDGNSYLDEDLFIENVTVIKPFAVTPVTYVYTGVNCTGARVGDPIVVPAGGYVWTFYGTYTTRTHSIGYVPDPSRLPTYYGLRETEGFDAYTLEASCSNCGKRWFASEGSWRFRANEHGEGPADWDYDNVEIPDDGPSDSIHCPTGCPGYVTFRVY